MPDVLVALYDDYRQADRVRSRLLAEGFPTDRIELTSREEHGQADVEPADTYQQKAGQYFETLFPAPNERRYVDFFIEGIKRGYAAVTVHPRGDDEVRSASAILEEHGPVDVEGNPFGRASRH